MADEWAEVETTNNRKKMEQEKRRSLTKEGARLTLSGSVSTSAEASNHSITRFPCPSDPRKHADPPPVTSAETRTQRWQDLEVRVAKFCWDEGLTGRSF